MKNVFKASNTTIGIIVECSIYVRGNYRSDYYIYDVLLNRVTTIDCQSSEYISFHISKMFLRVYKIVFDCLNLHFLMCSFFVSFFIVVGNEVFNYPLFHFLGFVSFLLRILVYLISVVKKKVLIKQSSLWYNMLVVVFFLIFLFGLFFVKHLSLFSGWLLVCIYFFLTYFWPAILLTKQSLKTSLYTSVGGLWRNFRATLWYVYLFPFIVFFITLLVLGTIFAGISIYNNGIGPSDGNGFFDVFFAVIFLFLFFFIVGFHFVSILIFYWFCFKK